jgi:PIN domain nuclease of toxin-antitoxin system
LGLDAKGADVPEQTPAVILLDTNALIWIDAGNPRARALLGRRDRLYVSPASLLELQFLHEAGKLRLRKGTVHWVMDDDRWLVDEPPPSAWFLRAVDVSWTRDPFDRLVVAHAQVRRWRLATSDGNIVDHLGSAASLEL